jgi:hypothetical protein
MKTKIVLKQLPEIKTFGGKKRLTYKVVALSQRTQPAIGEVLDEDTVKTYCMQATTTVEIKP